MRRHGKQINPIIMGGSAAIVISSFLALAPANASGTSFTAGVVMEKMSAAERYTFVAGIVEGLAMARYMKDGKKPEGMKCIYDFFYENPDIMRSVSTAFQKFPDYPPGTVIDVMTRSKCGD